MTTPVLFRKERSGPFKDAEVTAVFPTLPAGRGEMTCYAHIGQHSGCTLGWYNTTRPATPKEYAALLVELQNIYDNELRVCSRITQAMRDERNKAERA